MVAKKLSYSANNLKATTKRAVRKHKTVITSINLMIFFNIPKHILKINPQKRERPKLGRSHWLKED